MSGQSKQTDLDSHQNQNHSQSGLYSLSSRDAEGGASGVLGVDGGEAAGHPSPVLRLQAEGDALLHLLTAPQESAAVPGELLPRPVTVLILLATAGEELLDNVTETNLTRRVTCLSHHACLTRVTCSSDSDT